MGNDKEEAPKKRLLPFDISFLDDDLLEVAESVSTSDRLMLIFMAQIARNTGGDK